MEVSEPDAALLILMEPLPLLAFSAPEAERESADGYGLERGFE